MIAMGLKIGRFDDGNGEKILRRAINYARKFEAEIEDREFFRILLKRPALRGSILQWWLHSSAAAAKLELIRDFVDSREIIDDAAFLDVSVALVAARLPANVKTFMLVEEICRRLDTKSIWSFYSRLWILSKYGTVDEIMRVIESATSVWITEEQASRLVAGMYSRFVGTPLFYKFKGMMDRNGNEAARGVMDFFTALVTTSAGFTSIFKFLKAPNPSLPNKVSHAKFLMIRAALHNQNAEATMAALKAAHSRGLADEYYRALLPA